MHRRTRQTEAEQCIQKEYIKYSKICKWPILYACYQKGISLTPEEAQQFSVGRADLR